MLHGAWSDAVLGCQAACAGLAEPINPPTLGGALYIEAELHRLRGEFTMAEEPTNVPTRSVANLNPAWRLLRLAQGRVDVAAAQLRRLLAETGQPIARARMLCAAAEILLAADDIEGARSAADELSAVATELGSPLLRAHAALATGSVLLASGRRARRTGGSASCRRRMERAERTVRRGTHALAASPTPAKPSATSTAPRWNGAPPGRRRRSRRGRRSAATCRHRPDAGESHRPRGRGTGARRPGQDQPGDRRGALHQREDRRQPPQSHLHQARAHIPLGGHRIRL